MKCNKCGAEILIIEKGDLKIPIDRFTIEKRLVEVDGKWYSGRSAVSHYITCQKRKRFSLKE